MTELMDLRKKNTKLALYRTAMRIFLKKGYENTSIDEIVAKAGVSKGTFFNYFAAKSDVLEFWIRQWLQEKIEQAVFVPQGGLLANLQAFVSAISATEKIYLKITAWLIVEKFTAQLKSGHADDSHNASMVGLIARIIAMSKPEAMRNPSLSHTDAAVMLNNLWFGTILSCVEREEYDPAILFRNATELWYHGNYATDK